MNLTLYIVQTIGTLFILIQVYFCIVLISIWLKLITKAKSTCSQLLEISSVEFNIVPVKLSLFPTMHLSIITLQQYHGVLDFTMSMSPWHIHASICGCIMYRRHVQCIFNIKVVKRQDTGVCYHTSIIVKHTMSNLPEHVTRISS